MLNNEKFNNNKAKINKQKTGVAIYLNPKLKEDMVAKAGKTSVPQIWIGDSHIGGCDDLYAMHYAGALSEALS